MPDKTGNHIRQVLEQYNLDYTRVTLETSKEKKAVWWVETKNQKFILKKVPASRNRLLFLLSAIDHLRENGVNIPRIHHTPDGRPFIEQEEGLYVLMEAVSGKVPNYAQSRELSIIVEGMAAFHRASGGFTPLSGADVREHLGNWEKKYAQSVSELEKFRKTASVKVEFERFYLENCDYFITQGKRCQELLNNGPYSSWVEKVSRNINLCHQDFAAGNLGLVGGKLWVYDLDSITIDLPARDLRKILNKVMKKSGGWDLQLTTDMLKSYHKINPLSLDEYSVVFIDIRFPHLFHGICSKYFNSREKEWSSAKFLRRLQEMVKVEKSKEIIINNQVQIIDALF